MLEALDRLLGVTHILGDPALHGKCCERQLRWSLVLTNWGARVRPPGRFRITLGTTESGSEDGFMDVYLRWEKKDIFSGARYFDVGAFSGRSR